METNHPDAASQIFQAVVEREPSERESFLKEACGDDAALRSEVESLLRAHDQAGSFLEAPPLEMASAVLAQERVNSKIGRLVGSFEILALVGSGGMGEVYRARDTRLDRTVAIKFLPSGLSSNRELRQRLEREALAVSRLNHPNICTLFDIGQHENADYLVMEHLEGETLEKRLTRGHLALEQALRYGAQIADALQAAHRQGITHRDIKPANIMLVGESCKLLDFGLAKLNAPLALAAPSGSATAHGRKETAKGTILGTVQYMAPEQLEGKEVDGRTDIFAFGAVLYEMVTGHKAFQGQSNASLIAAIMSSNPAPVSTLQPMSPRALDHLVRRCLTKKPEERWQTALDVKKELEWIREGESGSESGAEPAQKPVGTTSRREWLVRAGSAAAGVTAGFLFFRKDAAPPAKDFRLFLPEDMALGSQEEYGGPAVSPDGSAIVLAARRNGKTELYLRRRGILDLQRLEGTEDAHHPFWSPDSKKIGFFARGSLKAVSTSSGPSQPLCPVSGLFDNQAKGGAWNRSDDIIFMGDFKLAPLSRFLSGKKAPLTTLDASRDERWHCWPWFLPPDQRHFLYLAWSPKENGQVVYVGSLDKPGWRPQLMPGHTSSVIYAAGHLLYVNRTGLVARPFDLRRLQLEGKESPIANSVAVTSSYRACFSAADTGFLVFYGEETSRLVSFDRESGSRSDLPLEVDRYRSLRLSPDGESLFYDIGGTRAESPRDSLTSDRLRIWNIRSRTPGSFKGIGGYARSLAFTADSRNVFFSGGGKAGVKPPGIYRTTLTKDNQSVRLPLDDEFELSALDVSHDDKFLLLQRFGFGPDRRTSRLCYVRLTGDGSPAGEPVPIDDDPELRTLHGRFSSKGLSRLWVAYTSYQGHAEEVYVRAFPPTKEKLPIRLGYGTFPVWTRGGKEIVFQSPDSRLMVASLEEVNSELVLKQPIGQLRFALPESSLGNGANGEEHWWDVSPDGNTIYVIKSLPTPVTVVDDWTSKLRT